MAGIEEDIMNRSEHDQSFLQLSAHETIEDFQMTEAGIVDPSSMDKEMLRKIKRKERTKLNRKKKKALQRNLNQVNATELQQSVSALATTIGINTPVLVNDPLNNLQNNDVKPMQIVGNTMPMPDDFELLSNRTVVTDHAAGSKTSLEIPLCVLDAANFSARLSNLDLIYITEYLEKSMFKDLTMVSKLKIDNIYLSASKRVWVICNSGTTSGWVTRRVAEMPPLNDRKYVVHGLAELEVMTHVTVLVPKETTLVNDYEDLIRFLTLQNPVLSRGLTSLEFPIKRPAQEHGNNDDAAEEDGVSGNKPDQQGQNVVQGDGASPNKTDAIECFNGFGEAPSSQPIIKPEIVSPQKQQSASTASGTSSEVERQPPAPRNRTFSFYADDTWLIELRRLGCRPYLGARRLLCVLGERMVQRSHDGGAGASKKRRRGGRRVPGQVQKTGKGDGEAGLDTTPAAVTSPDMMMASLA